MNKNDSFLEIAYRLMESKRRPRTLARITKDVFEEKGLNLKDESEKVVQFQMDFMLSGNFICCGEDKSGTKIWDLKSRQSSSFLDKDGSYLDDLYDFDDDISKHELKDDIPYKIEFNFDEDFEDDTDDDDTDTDAEETDDIEEELRDQESVDEDDEEDEDEEDDGIEPDFLD